MCFLLLFWFLFDVFSLFDFLRFCIVVVACYPFAIVVLGCYCCCFCDCLSVFVQFFLLYILLI